MTEYRLTMTIAEHGFSEDSAERCLDAFLKHHPEAGPVVSIDPASGTLSITVAVDATDPWAAGNLGAEILADGLNAAELDVTDIVRVDITAVEAEREMEARQRDFVPA